MSRCISAYVTKRQRRYRRSNTIEGDLDRAQRKKKGKVSGWLSGALPSLRWKNFSSFLLTCQSWIRCFSVSVATPFCHVAGTVMDEDQQPSADSPSRSNYLSFSSSHMPSGFSFAIDLIPPHFALSPSLSSASQVTEKELLSFQRKASFSHPGSR